MPKKIVQYDASKGAVVRVGQPAIVYPVDHPDNMRVSNMDAAITSVVISHSPDSGIFETQNSIYKPWQQNDMLLSHMPSTQKAG